ncbi:MAG: deoxyribonuclease IV [Phycisphaerales bacterium]
MLLGSHLSIAGSMVNALKEAESLGMSTVQVFTKNQQQWKAKPLDPAMVKDWHAELSRLGWDKGGPRRTDGAEQGRVVSHASYLINLASVNDELFAKSIDLMTDEIERCATLGIPFLVHHPGSFVGWTLAQGIARIASAYKELLKRTRGARVTSLLEGTAGAGSHIGGPFEHLQALRAQIIDATGEPHRTGFCLDTCHLHAAGHDMSTRTSAQAVLKQFDQMCGLDNLWCFHLNDSKGACGSHLDRHLHIGEGFVGAKSVGEGKTARPGKFSAQTLAQSGFAAVMHHPRCHNIPLILETPKEDAKEAARIPVDKRLDTMNLRRLLAIVGEDLIPPAAAQAQKKQRPPAKPVSKRR